MIYRETLVDGFTQSELTVMDECMFKWNKRYNERLELEGWYKLALIIGSAWHKYMENLYGSAGKNITVPVLELPEEAITTSADEEKVQQSQAMMIGMASAYRKYYANEISKIKVRFLEKEIAYVHTYKDIDIPFQFKIDMLAEEVLFDAKTTSMLRNDILAKWDFKFQFMFYCWGIAKARGLKEIKSFTVNAVKKPQIRQNQREPLKAFERRCEMVMLGQPSEYFYRNSISVTKQTLQHFEDEILVPKFERILMMRKHPDSPMWNNKNTENCHNYNETCQYFPICAEGASTKAYIQLPKKHTHYDKI